jgi:surface antigen/peptidoglycan hydrolase CwlO-like protein
MKARVKILVIAALVAVSVPVALLTKPASADKYDDQIAALQREIDRYQSAASKYDAKADTLQHALDAIKSDIGQLRTKMKLNQVEHDKLVDQIAKTEKEIKDNRDALGDVIADLGLENEISPLEMLASSKNISDYVDKQAYQQTIQDNLNATIKRINDLKEQLTKKKSNLETVLANQKRDESALAQKQNQQQSLVNQTRGQENAYLALRNKSKSQQRALMEAQAAAIAAASGGVGGIRFVGGGSGGYPWNSSNCYVDQNAMSYGGADGGGGDGWGYGCRQCASYAAWKVGQYTGVIPTNLGNANQWPSSLANRPQGYTARPHSVGVIMSGAYGHVVWVESGPDSSGYITVSQYNANYTGNPNNWGNFTRVRVPQSTYSVFIYF